MNQLLESLRRTFFWLLDSVKGAGVGRHVKELTVFYKSNAAQRQAKVDDKLNDLLGHAVATVPFYKGLAGKSLSDFPVVHKTLIRDNEESFLSSSFTEDKRFPVITSGSTGTPFRTYQDADKKKRNSADTIYFAKKAGFEVGHRLVYLKIWSDYNKKAPLQQWMQNIWPIDVISLDNEKIKSFVEEIEKDSSTFSLLGYSSALELVAKYLEGKNHGKVKADVRSIISMSESLNDYTKNTLPKFFGCAVLSRYSNIENGILAQQEAESGASFFINTASYIVEILKMDSDEPVKQGELGRIVVTDLYNYAMPMLRYDTGDIGSFLPEDNNYLGKIEGRKLDLIYNTSGELVSSYIMYKNMWQYTEIEQYQLVQYGLKDYLFKINCAGPFGKEEKLAAEYKQYLGEDANFRIEYVDEIPLLASGKRKKVVNTYYK